MPFRQILPAVLFTLTCLLSIPAGVFAQSSSRPNVIIVMTDDQGYGELSAHGNPVLKTPFLDQLRTQSVRFSDFHVTPMCAPTRGQLLTGIQAGRNGAINVSSGRALLRPEMVTMADMFKDAGYQTGIFGKWHLGDNYPFRPQDRGFDESLWFPSSHIGAVPDYWGNDYFDDTYIHNGERKAFKGYCTDIFFNEAMGFIQKARASGKPFLAYIPTNAPHGPFNARPEDEALLRKALEAPAFKDMPAAFKANLARYLGMIHNIDQNMGRLMGFLEKEGLAQNTILIFLTDNGTIMGTQYYNAGMRGMKTELFEGGHRVPLFIRWPAGEFGAPRDIDGLAAVQDILPTLVELCGLRRQPLGGFDGVSLVPVLRGKERIPEERMLIINYSRMSTGFGYPAPYGQSQLRPEGAAVLYKRWRLLEDRELYNLADDPLQERNVIDRHPAIVAKMRNHLQRSWDLIKDIANEPQRIIVGSDQENPTRLTACEWLDVFVDQQRQVRQGVTANGYWELFADRDGEYEIELRRWPKEANAPLQGKTAENDRALPIQTARIFINTTLHRSVGEKRPYGFEGAVEQVKPGDVSAKFLVQLKRGPFALHTWFDDSEGGIRGAYYVYVTRR